LGKVVNGAHQKRAKGEEKENTRGPRRKETEVTGQVRIKTTTEKEKAGAAP